MTIGEESVILIGQITATIPKTRLAGTMIAPIRSPRIIHVWPFLAEAMAKYASGIVFPKATIRIPTKARFIFNPSAKNLADSTIPTAAIKRITKPKMAFPKSVIRYLNSLTIGSLSPSS